MVTRGAAVSVGTAWGFLAVEAMGSREILAKLRSAEMTGKK